jgi:hypothetical protein
MNWQPIETAPKDEDYLLLLFNGRTTVGGWTPKRTLSSGRHTWERPAGWWTQDDSGHSPTHWMPLPEPPK